MRGLSRQSRDWGSCFFLPTPVSPAAFETPSQQARAKRVLGGQGGNRPLEKLYIIILKLEIPLPRQRSPLLKKVYAWEGARGGTYQRSNPFRPGSAGPPSRLPARVLVPGGHRPGPTGAEAETGRWATCHRHVAAPIEGGRRLGESLPGAPAVPNCAKKGEGSALP